MKSLKAMIAIGVSVILIGHGQCQEKSMGARNLKFDMRPLVLNDMPSIVGLKLLETPQGVQLISSITKRGIAAVGAQTVISATPLIKTDQQMVTLFTIEQLLPPPPAWDIAINANGAYAVVYENALGATYVLEVISTGKTPSQTTVPAGYSQESFTTPNFIRRQTNENTRRISAIVDKKTGVVFAKTQDGSYQEQGELCQCAEALIVPYRDHFLLFYKVIVPGAVRGKLTSPGKLFWRPLDKGLVPTGDAREALADQTVFEFEVDVAEDVIAVVATTKSGTKLALSKAPEEAFSITAFDEVRQGESFSKPSVVIAKAQVYVALLENATLGQARILTGSAPITTLR
jgi:hypothetical protein